MKIYTKTGDSGETGLWGGYRVSKDALRVQAYGTVDECNALIGMARATQQLPEDIDQLLGSIQNQLFVVGSDLATPGNATTIPRISENEILFLEESIDALETELEPLRQFILPGGCSAAATLHFARTVCRRAERAAVTLSHHEGLNPQVLVYLNRLSDFLFVVARATNARAGVNDIPWISPRLAKKG